MDIAERIRRVLLPMLMAVMLAVPVRGTEDCVHELVYHRVESVCRAQGCEWYECALCGYTCQFKLLPAVPHDFCEWYVLTEPTCTQPGVQVRDCAVCKAREEEPIPNPGHQFTVEVREPTCTARGYSRSICTVCREVETTWDHVPALGHSYDDGVLLREPTDTTKGHVLFTCVRCGHTDQMTYTFRDIDADSYYFTPVIWAVNHGITSGIDETQFGPAMICNRAQVVTFLWRAAGRPIPAMTGNPFLDVPKGSFYEQAVLWAYETGITTGTAARRFSPDAPCNRAQVVTFLHRARGCPEPDLTAGFDDVEAGSFYHKAVLWAAQRGITQGMDGGLFCPELPCSRAQIVTFLYRDEKNP